jgi:3',5'-cyclic-nucleotide phosphodiesterase
MNRFHIIALGCMGGPYEDNLSGYLLFTEERKHYIVLDAGSLLGGLAKAIAQGVLPAVSEREFLTHHIQGYLISHAHLDHVAGLVINSQIDKKKAIYGLDETINHLRDHLFNGKIWPNYGSEGEHPLCIYTYRRVTPECSFSIENTSFSATPFILHHPEPHQSTAFLIENQGNYILYFGDTASDAKSKTKRLMPIWRRIAPLIDQHRLRGIFLECSYAHAESKNAIFGHLDTHMMLEELRELRKLCKSLVDLKVVVTHRKQVNIGSEDGVTLIEKELTRLNDMGLKFIFPTQGQEIIL